ncbi:MAG: NUDIX domain-containing protein [Candidatus Aenigmarchaeota archaeon]|nr:NUDIX domain-containing protein [Candidatus Aenigmarchaeota archaeon]
MESPEDMVDVVDKNDVTIGAMKRKDLLARKANFRTVHVFLLNKKGELLLQKVPASRTRAPGWGSSAAAYVRSGESYDEAAKRIVEEELRLRNVLLEFRGKAAMTDSGCRKFISLYKAVHDGPVTLLPGFTEGAEFLTFGKIGDLAEHRSREFTPAFLYLLDFLLAKGKR